MTIDDALQVLTLSVQNGTPRNTLAERVLRATGFSDFMITGRGLPILPDPTVGGMSLQQGQEAIRLALKDADVGARRLKLQSDPQDRFNRPLLLDVARRMGVKV